MFYELMDILYDKKDDIFIGLIIAFIAFLIAYISKIIYESILKKLCKNRHYLTSDENYFIMEVLNKLIKSLSKRIKKDKSLRYHQGKINNIKNLIKSGGYENLTKAKELLEFLLNEIIDDSDMEMAQEIIEGLSSLYLLTNDIQNVNMYYDQIVEKFPNLPRNNNLYKIINKYNVTYPVKYNGNITLGRINVSRFNKIFNELEITEASFVRFNIHAANISKKPTKSKWFCNTGYIIYGKNREILGGSLNESHSEKHLSRFYSYDEIKTALLLMNEGVGYRIL